MKTKDTGSRTNRERHKVVMKRIRKDCDYKSIENERSKSGMKRKRRDVDYKSVENERNKIGMKRRRKDVDYKSVENERNKIGMKRRRTHGDYKSVEELKRKQKILEEYYNGVKEGPTFICSCCGGLWFRSSVTMYTVNDLREKHLNKKFILSVIMHRPTNHIYFCSTCNRYILKGIEPRLSLNNGLVFDDIPPELSDLTELEERLVAARIPFMQIRKLGVDQQFGLRGNLVNVPNNIDSSVSSLPRNFHETSTLQLKFKRKLEYKHAYMYETIRPAKVIQAAEFLVKQPLYLQENIGLSCDWRERHAADIENFIVNDEDRPAIVSVEPRMDEASTSSEMESDGNLLTADDELDDHERVELNAGMTDTLLNSSIDENIGIALAPGEGYRPLPLLLDQFAEEMSFPSIYCGRARQLRKKLTYTEIARSEVRRFDRRCAKIPKIFFTYKKLQILRLANEISVCLRKLKLNSANLTAKNMLNPDFVDALVKHDDAYRITKHDRASPAFWEQRKKEAVAMLRQLACPTFFLTLSAAETKWLDLIVILYKTVRNEIITIEQANELSFQDRAELIRQDPVTCARYFEHKINLLFKLLKCDCGPFGAHVVTDSYIRTEFQHRGAPHVHSLIWLHDSPTYDFEDEAKIDACVKFIDKFCTVDKTKLREENAHLIKLQEHKHSFTCWKHTRNGKVCRFGIPTPPMSYTRIIQPYQTEDENEKQKLEKNLALITSQLDQLAKSVDIQMSFSEFLDSLSLTEEEYLAAISFSLKRPKVFLRRSPGEILLNAFNPDILQLHQSNMDIQFVINPFACIQYILNYINKSNRGMSLLLREAVENLRQGNYSVRERLRCIANKFINATEVSAQEAVYYILGMPVSQCSRECVYINTSLPTERVHMLKPRDQLELLEPESEEIVAKDLIQHYEERPRELYQICLAEFAAFYDYGHLKDIRDNSNSTDEPSDDAAGPSSRPEINKKSSLKRRARARIIRYRHYNIQQDRANFFREQVLLFLQFNNEKLDILSVDAEQLYYQFHDLIMKNRAAFVAENAESIDKAIEDAEKAYDDELDQEADLPEDAKINNPYGMYENANASIDAMESMGLDDPKPQVEYFKVPKLLSDLEYENLICSLNNEQRKYLMHAIYQVETDKEMFEFITGGPGSGKSYLISALYQVLLRRFKFEAGSNLEDVKVLLCAFTGKAAFEINGMTLHHTFQLPINQSADKMQPLSADISNKLAVKLAKLRVLIMDEVSMIGGRLFAQVNERLMQIMHSKKPFGGVKVILFGDFVQLRPVRDCYVFESDRKNEYALLAGSNPLWEKFLLYELTENMRQKEEKEFATALRNFANGTLTERDIALFKSRELKRLPADAVPVRASHLFHTNAEVNAWNESALKLLATEECIVNGLDSCIGDCTEDVKKSMLRSASNLEPEKAGGLPSELHLKISATYLVTVNVDTEDGVVNGAIGTLRAIDYSNNNKPVRVWLEFKSEKVGIIARQRLFEYRRRKNIPEAWTPIDYVIRSIKRTPATNISIVRKQFPLVVCEAMTIHKIQGSTLKEPVIVKITKQMSKELINVALSRVTKASDLFIDGEFDPKKSKTRTKGQLEHDRMLKECSLEFRVTYLQDLPINSLKIAFQNIQSLGKHLKFLKCDPFYRASDLIALVETWTLPHDLVDFEEKSCMCRLDCSSERKPFGSMLFVNERSNCLIQGVQLYASEAMYGFTFHLNNIGICVLHKLPRTTLTVVLEFLNEAFTRLLSLESEHFIFMGDFNINIKEMRSGSCQRLLSWFNSKHLSFKLPPNENSTYNHSQIDLCFSDLNQLKGGYYENVHSYHKTIWLELPFYF